jgi:hypothetical protein
LFSAYTGSFYLDGSQNVASQIGIAVCKSPISVMQQIEMLCQGFGDAEQLKEAFQRERSYPFPDEDSERLVFLLLIAIIAAHKQILGGIPSFPGKGTNVVECRQVR